MTAKKNKQLKQSGPADNVSVNITEKLKATAKELVNAWAAVDGDDLYTHGISKIRIQCQDAAFASRCIQHIRVVAEAEEDVGQVANRLSDTKDMKGGSFDVPWEYFLPSHFSVLAGNIADTAECVAVEEMGIVSMKFGRKPMIKFAFEIDEENQFGQKRRLTRLFHLHTHPLSAVSLAVKQWCGRNLADEVEYLGGVDWQSFVGERARIKLEPGAVKGDKCYENIVEILASDDEAWNPSCEIDDVAKMTNEPKETE